MKYERLRLLRISRNISLQDMADALGLKTAGGYLRIESGENKLKAEHLPIIAKKFEVSLEELIAFLFEDQLDECSTSSNEQAVTSA
ncbi:hypothetical protein DNHGIG_14720 [Collibacillus ludicampi]|uniref:HTH cro/C1-type domain-containing protein n=1 Tax=Collibacillus ludicampi TaxID=2771369 RepID=A0AAV4LDS8_9BACL|nr:helix-turn-helix transcriptional regulator [Collibacillus ludicampi]GIM45923.1 hypothetical protein DNHGIG_14720 [Collibacillus ludicampi]